VNSISKVISGNIPYLIAAFFVILGIALIVLHHMHMGPISIFVGAVIAIGNILLRRLK